MSLAPALDARDDIINKKVLYSGPIPSQQHISRSDIVGIIEHQRNFIVPFLNMTLCKQNLDHGSVDIKDAIAISSKIISDRCGMALDSIPSSEINNIGHSDLLPEQMNSIMSVMKSIKELRRQENIEKEEVMKKREEIVDQLKSPESVRDRFREHAEKLDDAAKQLFEMIPELNDEEMLDEFSLKEMRDAGKAPWLLPD